MCRHAERVARVLLFLCYVYEAFFWGGNADTRATQKAGDADDGVGARAQPGTERQDATSTPGRERGAGP